MKPSKDSAADDSAGHERPASPLFSGQRQHEACAAALREAEPPLIISSFVLAELDYLITKNAGVEAELEFLVDVAAGAYEVASFAERYGTADVLTLDERHFRSLRTKHGDAFRLLPADGRPS